MRGVYLGALWVLDDLGAVAVVFLTVAELVLSCPMALD